MAVKVKQENFQSTNRIIYSHRDQFTIDIRRHCMMTRLCNSRIWAIEKRIGNSEGEEWGVGGVVSQLSKCAIEQSLLNNPDQAQWSIAHGPGRGCLSFANYVTKFMLMMEIVKTT